MYRETPKSDKSPYATLIGFAKLNGYNQTQIAEKLGVTRMNISNCVRQSTGGNIETLIKIAEVTDCEIIVRSKQTGLEMALSIVDKAEKDK